MFQIPKLAENTTLAGKKKAPFGKYMLTLPFLLKHAPEFPVPSHLLCKSCFCSNCCWCQGFSTMLNKVHAQKASWKDFYLIPLINHLAFTEKTQQDPTMLERALYNLPIY